MSSREPALTEELIYPLRLWKFHCPKGVSDVMEFLDSVLPKDLCVPKDDTTLILYRSFSLESQSDSDISPEAICFDLEAQVYQNVSIFVSGPVHRRENLDQALIILEKLSHMAEKQHSRSRVHEFEKLLLPSLFYHLAEGSLDAFESALEQFSSLGLDQELLDTAIEFLQRDLNVTETASRLYIHRNTLLYRLGKIRALTGYDIRKFPEAVSFYLLHLKRSF